MNFRKADTLSAVLAFIGTMLVLAAILIRGSPTINAAVGSIGGVFILVGVVINFAYCRCPYCRRYLRSSRLAPYCPWCGKELDD